MNTSQTRKKHAPYVLSEYIIVEVLKACCPPKKNRLLGSKIKKK